MTQSVKVKVTKMLNSGGLSPDTSDLENNLIVKDSLIGNKALYGVDTERGTVQVHAEGFEDKRLISQSTDDLSEVELAFQCMICGKGSSPDDLTKLPCGHKAKTSCLKEIVEEQLKLNPVGVPKITCHVKVCDKTMTKEMMIEILGEDSFKY